MEEADKQAWVALIFIVALSAGLGFAGGDQGVKYNGLSVFMIGVMVSFAVNWIAFIPAYIWSSEKFYDITGSVSFLSVMLVCLFLSSNYSQVSIFLVAMVSIWTLRLGLFLFIRVQRTGGDSRFDQIKLSFPRYLMTWSLQAMWVVFTLAPTMASLTSQDTNDINTVSVIGICIWSLGFGIELLSDSQKDAFKSKAENKGKFMRTGLWRYSRHPNYFGEILLWLGIAVVCLPILKGAQWVTMISPIFVIVLLTKVSGIPILEASSDKKYGEDIEYQKYKQSTPILVPWWPSKLEE